MILTRIDIPKFMKSVKGYRRKAFASYRYQMFKDEYEFIYLLWYNPKEESKNVFTSIYYRKIGAPIETMQLIPDEVLEWGSTLDLRCSKINANRFLKDERFSPNFIYNLRTIGKADAYLLECSPMNEFLNDYNLQILSWCLHQDKVHCGNDAIEVANLCKKAMDAISEIDGVGKYARVIDTINCAIETKRHIIEEEDEDIRKESERIRKAKEELAKMGFHE